MSREKKYHPKLNWCTVTQHAGLNLAFVLEKEKEKEMYPQNCTGVQVTNKAYISINSCSNDFKFCMLLNLTKLYEPNNKNMDKTKPNQSKPNQTSLPLNAKYSAISYPIKLKFGMYDK